MNKVITIGMAEIAYSELSQPLRTSGLGSCVGVIIYQEGSNHAGMAHIMLPSASISTKKVHKIGKFADVAIPELTSELVRRGASTYRLKAKIAGGAQMFASSGNEMMRVGERNVVAVKEQLNQLNISLVAEDTGGTNGRTILFDPKTQALTIRTVHLGTKVI
ncbi:chemotaxis protein CheD [Alkalicoccobacillus murimartini]|uniref:Probable chemoreceptor glutamine deamidase CheD n=1 Tax=Alkalicoccobacillus murimartini TaxID=171685 RepID=A0ABT9YGH8_9BACI|nr:chemotaxis protein CheD [Alkalicoccobacillus murimartini]MDQ0206322.1 chemotaxis protein CheD [Alkalicoccobacillus murimartini]